MSIAVARMYACLDAQRALSRSPADKKGIAVRVLVLTENDRIQVAACFARQKFCKTQTAAKRRRQRQSEPSRHFTLAYVVASKDESLL